MKLKKLISSSLAIGLLFNTTLTSFASVLSEDGRYETFEGNNITIDNVLEEGKVDIEIEGNTLVNLADIKSNFEVRNMNGWYKDFTICETSKLKLNTDYTLFIYKELLDNHNENYNVFEFGVGNNIDIVENHPMMDSSSYFVTNYHFYFNKDKQKEVLTIKFQFKDFKNFKYLAIRPIRRYSAPVTNEYCNANIKILFLEGNYSTFDIPYFEDIQSVGQDDINGHKIEIISTDDKIAKNNIETPLTEPLRALPNGVKDRIIKKNGQWVIERNCKEVIFNGNENWAYEPEVSYIDTTSLFSLVISDVFLPGENEVSTINNKLPNTSRTNVWYKSEEGVSNMRKNLKYPAIGIRIKTSKLTEQTSSAFKQWLSENPITVVYQLEEPVYEPINIDLSLNTYLDTTYISNNSTIPANMKVTIDRAINRAVDTIELAKANPTVENLSKARMWINLLDDSIKKDELQSEISRITNIEDLQLDKKNITTNMDVYIKSQNSLSMSLSTNSILFDEFSGVEDLEKLNAVEITISSSLPYQLNSYLESEIKNSDGSKIIPKELLNIRLNGENGYKAFYNINEKLVLKENCEKGNDNQFSIDLILKGDLTHKADTYKTVIKFEAEQK